MSRNEDLDTKDPKQEWVHFDDDGHEVARRDDSPAILDAEAVQVTLENKRINVEASIASPTKRISHNEPSSGARHVSRQPKTGISVSEPQQESQNYSRRETVVAESPLNPANLQNVPLSEQSITVSRPPTTLASETGVIRQGFANGDVIVTILPQNSVLPWITPAKFRPELVPEELMAQGLTLTVEDYVHVMSQLVNDHRFTLYNICYKRVLIAWITLAFLILLCILFGHFPHLVMFGAGIAWLMVNAGAIFFCMWIKIRLNKNLERCLSGINMQLMKHKILLGVDDRGKISCHKINLCFIYFDPQECIDKLQKLIDQDSEPGRNGNLPTINERLDFEDPEIIITGATNTRISQRQERAVKLFSSYSQRWAKEFLRKRLDWAFDASARLSGLCPPVAPRHISTARCPCQFIEEYFGMKAMQNPQKFCSCLSNFCRDNHARNLLARYSQRWVKVLMRGGLSLGIDASERTLGGILSSPSHHSLPPRHMATQQCPCQYIEDHLQYKPQGWLSLCNFWQRGSNAPPTMPICA